MPRRLPEEREEGNRVLRHHECATRNVPQMCATGTPMTRVAAERAASVRLSGCSDALVIHAHEIFEDLPRGGDLSAVVQPNNFQQGTVQFTPADGPEKRTKRAPHLVVSGEIDGVSIRWDQLHLDCGQDEESAVAVIGVAVMRCWRFGSAVFGGEGVCPVQNRAQ